MGKDRASNRSQRFELFGSIPALIRRLMTRLQIYMGMDIDTGEDMLTGNPNRRRFSESAVQEAIVNAFVHRDYRSHDPVRVTLFNDRLEVTSPGGPNTPFNAGQIREGRVHTSWRNPSLAWFMVELKFAQNEGKGIQIIMEQTKKIAGKEPGFFINSHWFSVEIPAFIPLLDSFQEKKEKVEVDFDVKNELRRLLKKFADKDSDFHKNIISSKKGMDTAEKLAESYNKFAQWLSGLPMVPGLFLQDK
jgi:predicted HTH transcriptional regulator